MMYREDNAIRSLTPAEHIRVWSFQRRTMALVTLLELGDRLKEDADVALMRSTGIKDIDGKPIFEFDLMDIGAEWQSLTGASRQICLVCFSKGGFQYGRGISPYWMDSYLWLAGASEQAQIIGNIFESPHLISPPNEDECHTFGLPPTIIRLYQELTTNN